MSYLVSQYVDGGEPGGGVRPAERVGGAELGHHARVRGQAHAAHGRQPHGHAVAAPTLFWVEI